MRPRNRRSVNWGLEYLCRCEDRALTLGQVALTKTGIDSAREHFEYVLGESTLQCEFAKAGGQFGNEGTKGRIEGM